MRKKKIIIMLGILVFVAGCSQKENAKVMKTEAIATAASELKDIPLNIEYFPEDYFRRYLAAKYDSDQNGILSEKERGEVKKLCMRPKGVCKAIGEEYVSKTKIELDITGIQYLTELEHIEFENWELKGIGLDKLAKLKELQMEGYGLDEFVKMNIPNLEKLIYREESSDIEVFDASGLPALKELWLATDGSGKIKKMNLTGNEELENLRVSSNGTTEVDITRNKKLRKLECWNLGLKNMDVSNNKQLTYMDVSGNALGEIDLSNNVKLTYLCLSTNQLKTLDVSKLKKLKELYVFGNKLKEISTRNNPKLKFFNCNDNEIEKIDVSQNTKLKWFICGNNKLKRLDISKLKQIEDVFCGENMLKELNLSNNRNLIEVFCQRNKIKQLDLSKQKKLKNFYIASNRMKQLAINKRSLRDAYAKEPIKHSDLWEEFAGNKLHTLDIRAVSSMNKMERKGLKNWISYGKKYKSDKDAVVNKLVVSKNLAAKDKVYVQKIAKKYKVTVSYVS